MGFRATRRGFLRALGIGGAAAAVAPILPAAAAPAVEAVIKAAPVFTAVGRVGEFGAVACSAVFQATLATCVTERTFTYNRQAHAASDGGEIASAADDSALLASIIAANNI